MKFIKFIIWICFFPIIIPYKIIAYAYKLILNNAVKEQSSTTHKRKYRRSYTFNVAGVTKKNDVENNIQELLDELVKEEVESSGAYLELTNKEILEDYYDERIYETTDVCGSDEVYFMPEPDNAYDPNAIKVIHEYLDHIGYVPRECNILVGDILKNTEYNIYWKLVGGRYKYIDDNGKVKTKKDNYGVNIKINYK